MGDAWLKNKEYGDCNREIDYEDLGRWFRCASKVSPISDPFNVPYRLLSARVICVCRCAARTGSAEAWAMG